MNSRRSSSAWRSAARRYFVTSMIRAGASAGEGPAGVRYLHRPANLEDVFLRLTGREMVD